MPDQSPTPVAPAAAAVTGPQKMTLSEAFVETMAIDGVTGIYRVLFCR